MTHCKTHCKAYIEGTKRAHAGHIAKTNFGLSIGRLTGGKHTEKKNFDLSTSLVSKEFRWELLIVDAELVAWSVRLDVL